MSIDPHRRRIRIALIISTLILIGAIVIALRLGTLVSWGVVVVGFSNVMVFYSLLRKSASSPS